MHCQTDLEQLKTSKRAMYTIYASYAAIDLIYPNILIYFAGLMHSPELSVSDGDCWHDARHALLSVLFMTASFAMWTSHKKSSTHETAVTEHRTVVAYKQALPHLV